MNFILQLKLLVQQFDHNSMLFPFFQTDDEAFILIQQIHYLTIFKDNDLSKSFHQFREKYRKELNYRSKRLIEYLIRKMNWLSKFGQMKNILI